MGGKEQMYKVRYVFGMCIFFFLPSPSLLERLFLKQTHMRGTRERKLKFWGVLETVWRSCSSIPRYILYIQWNHTVKLVILSEKVTWYHYFLQLFVSATKLKYFCPFFQALEKKMNIYLVFYVWEIGIFR